jgi:hypothetical protein
VMWVGDHYCDAGAVAVGRRGIGRMHPGVRMPSDHEVHAPSIVVTAAPTSTSVVPAYSHGECDRITGVTVRRNLKSVRIALICPRPLMPATAWGGTAWSESD